MDVDLGELALVFGREVTAYTVEPIDPQLRFHSVTGGVYRVRAEGESLVVKIVQQGSDVDPDGLWVSGAEPSHRNYWKREWEAYCSGLLDSLPGELRAPRTVRCTEPAPDECWIWMEDVEGHPGGQWRVGDYDSVAFDLATTQAAYASGRSLLPGYPWLSRNWLRGWVDTLGRRIGVLDDEAAWPDADLAAIAELRPRLHAVWAEREALLTTVESATQTLVHCDFWPANLIAADDGTTVAMDWSQVGVGAVAQDLDQLTLDPVWMQVLPDSALDDLQTGVLRGYLSGLRTSGMAVSESDVRRWYAAAAGVRYAPMAGFLVSAAADPDGLQARFNRPFADIVRARIAVVQRAVELAESVLDDG